MILSRYKLRESYDGVDVFGVDVPSAVLHHGDLAKSNVVVLKVPGHKYWTGIGMDWGYEPASFWVMERGTGNNEGWWILVIQFPVRKVKG